MLCLAVSGRIEAEEKGKVHKVDAWDGCIILTLTPTQTSYVVKEVELLLNRDGLQWFLRIILNFIAYKGPMYYYFFYKLIQLPQSVCQCFSWNTSHIMHFLYSPFISLLNFSI